MTNPDPIQQRIEIDADTQGADESVRAINEVREAGEEANRATDQGADASDRQARANRENADALRDMASGTTLAAGAAGKLNRQLLALASGAAVVAGLREVISLARQELESFTQTADAAFQNQVTIASAERSLKLNLPGASDDEVQRAIDAARSISEQRSVPIAESTSALASALSARGGNLDEAIAVTDLAAQIRPDQPSAIAGIAGAIGDVGDAIGTDDPTAALGFLLTVGGQSRVADFNAQASSIPAALAGITGEGFSPSGAGALFSALSVGAKDLTGDSTRTASIQLAAQVNAFFTASGRPERGASAIAALQQDPSLRNQFLENFSLEARFNARAIALLSDPSSSIAQGFARNLGGFGDTAALRGTGLQKLDQLSDGQLEGNAQLNRDLASLVDQLSADNVSFGTVGAIRDQLVPLLQQTGSPALATRLEGLSFDLNNFASPDEATDDLIGILQRRVNAIRNRAVSTTVGGSPGSLPTITRRALSQDERRAIETIQRVIRQIQERRGAAVGDQFIENGQPIGTIDFATGRGFGRTISPEIDDPLLDQSDRSNPTTINNFINNGTQINGAGDYRTDDQDGRDLE